VFLVRKVREKPSARAGTLVAASPRVVRKETHAPASFPADTKAPAETYKDQIGRFEAPPLPMDAPIEARRDSSVADSSVADSGVAEAGADAPMKKD